MTISNFIPTIWSARLLENLNNAHVFAQLCNRDYEGEIRGMGSTVTINAIGHVTIESYTKNSNITAAETLSDASTTLTIDTAKSFNFQIDDVDKAQQTPKIMNAAMQDAAWGLAEAVDDLLAAVHSSTPAANKIGADNSITVGGSLTAGSAFYDLLVNMKVILDQNNTPLVGRWVVVPPWAHGMMLKDSRFINATDQGNRMRADGLVGQAAGFNVYMSNNVTNSGTGISTDAWRVMAGYPGTISYAEQILNVEAYRPELRHADAVKGLLVCGYKVVRPANLCTLYVKSAAS